MSKLGYILSIFCLVAYSFADDIGCMNPDACNYDELATQEGECVSSPGSIDDFSVQVNDGENVAVIDWSQPCGLGNIFAYSLVGTIENEDVDISISSPHIIEALSWSSSYNLTIHTLSEFGESSTPIGLTIGPETIPGQIQGLVAEAGEASISLSWDAEANSSNYNIYLDGEVTFTTSDNITSAVVSGLNTNIDFEFQVSGLNSEAGEGEQSELVIIQVLPIFPVTEIESSSGAGQVTFSWLSPDPYADDNDYAFIIFDESDNIIEENYTENSYLIDDLQVHEQRCIKISAIHQFGVSEASSLVCESSNIPPPTEVEGLYLTSGEGFVSLTWNNHPASSYYNIYRDDNLITEEAFWAGGNGVYIDSLNITANTQYEYVVVALNANAVEGVYHNPISIIVTPLPNIQDIESLAGNGRIVVDWSVPPNYAEFGYSYELHDAFGGFVKSTNLTQTHIPDLEQGVEYCFTVRSVSLGGFGYSDDSDIFCATPEAPFGESLEWAIQIIAELTYSNGNPIANVDNDEYNLIGVDPEATNEYDSEFDVIEPPVISDRISLFFSHPEWGHSIGGQFIEKYTQDVRADVDLSSSVINWDAQIESQAGGYPELIFYFNNIVDNTVYLNDGVSFKKIEDGEIVRLGYLPSSVRSSISIIVGNAIPEPPINLAGFGGYRETTITWEDPCCQSGLQQYPAQKFNIWRNGELKGENITGNTFIDRGLDFSSLYTYEVSAINIAGEGDKSFQVLELLSLENRPPVSKAGMDIVVYDLQDDNEENTSILLPVYSDFSNDNQSYDPDNSYEEDGDLYLYLEPLDDLAFTWTSASNSQHTDPELAISIEGYGEKGFQLQVNDGTELFSIDSVFVSYLAAPAPALVDSVNIQAGLYNIELDWLESMFTGESYADLNNNLVWDDKEPFEDCGFDNLCPGDLNYIYPDEGEGNYAWDFEDLNESGWVDEGERFEGWNDDDEDGFWDDFEPFLDIPNEDGLLNGMYDGGPRPRPPFYGLPSNLGPDNLATKYIIRRNDLIYLEFMASDTMYLNPSQDGDLLKKYTLLDEDLLPSTEYCYQILSCNFNDLCTHSEEVCRMTKDRPTVSVISPNGAEIVGNGSLDIELEFENVESISTLDIYLSYDGEFNQDTQTLHLLSTDDINTSYEDIDPSNFQGYTNEVKVKATITDIGGYTITNASGGEFANYSDESDYQFIISESQKSHDFEAGWHLFGTPVGLENPDFYTALNNSGVGFNWTAFAQNGDDTNLSLNSGEGYYFWMYSPANMQLSGELFNQFDIPLEAGWNLISNPLIETFNMGAIDVLRGNGELLPVTEAISLGLVSSRMLGFDNSSATHIPSFEIESFMGYWIFAYEADLVLKIQNKLNPELISDPDESSDWRMKLSARAFGAGEEWYNPFGDIIDLGFSVNASDGFRAGEDEHHLPFNSTFPSYTNFKIDNSNWLSENEGLDSPYFSQDIHEANDTLYVWNIIGESLNISHTQFNQYGEIVLSWEMGDLSEEYSILLHIGNASIDMRNQNGNQIAISEQEFENIRVEVRMIEYTSGCSDDTACNYYCYTNVDCDGSNKPEPFYDDGSCEYTSCVGCSDPFASNYNPNAGIDLSTCEYLQSFLLLADKNIYPEPEIENRIPINLHNYDSENIYGIEVQLAIDPEKIIVSDIDISTGIFAEESISVNDDTIDSDYSLIWGYTSEVQDTLGIVLYSSADPINPYGINKMFDLVLEVTGDIGQQVTIDFVKSDLNIREINTNFQKLNIVKGLFQIGGSVEYYSNEDAVVDDAVVDLVGISEFTTLDTAYNDLSDSSGDILFPAVLRGDYLSVMSKEDNSINGLSAVDASRIARYSVGLIDFNSDERYIADVDLNGWINAFDASAVARLLVGNVDSLNEYSLAWRFIPKDENLLSLFDQSFISTLFNGSQESINDFEYPLDWIFTPSLIDMEILESAEEFVDALQNEDGVYVDEVLKIESLSPIVEDFINQEIVGYKIGDVDGDWDTDVVNLSKVSEMESHYVSIAEEDEFLMLPIAIEEKNLIEGIELEISFDADIFNLSNIEIVSHSLTQDNYQTIISESEYGVSLIIYCTSSIVNHDGVLADIKFEIINTITDDTHIDINRFRVNGRVNEFSGFRIADGDSYSIAQSVAFITHSIPESYSLSQNYPNPFNPSTNIPFALPYESMVKIHIYDVRGRLIQELINLQLSSGYHNLSWDASHLASGLYFIQFESSSLENSETFSTIQKSLLVK